MVIVLHGICACGCGICGIWSIWRVVYAVCVVIVLYSMCYIWHMGCVVCDVFCGCVVHWVHGV